MRAQSIPLPLLQLLTAILLAPRHTMAGPISPSDQAGMPFNELFARDCVGGTLCGYYSQLCCSAGSACSTNAMNQATCTAVGAAATGTGGYWQLYTTTYTQTDLKTVTATMSSYVGGPTGNSGCHAALGEQKCGSICCASDQFCFSESLSQCAQNPNAGSSGFYSTMTPGATATPGAPLRGTSSGVTTTTATNAQTTTVPFIPAVATGANITVTGESTSNSGLSGGAIAGIVIGVLAALLLLGLILFCCCIRGLIDGCFACFGLGKKQRRTEVEEYERYSHHTSGGQRRTWYGAPVRTSRPAPKRNNEGFNIIAIFGGLAALWAILGLKRRHDRKEEREKDALSEYTYSDDYYTSASSESSDRRTRDTRRERSMSRVDRSMSRR